MGQPLPVAAAPGDGAASIAHAPDGELVVCRSYAIPAGIAEADLVAHVRRLSTVTHPNLVPILGAEVRDGRLWVYSEHDGGRSLAQLLSRSAVSSPAAVAVGLSILAGLQALQRAGFAHGALSPATVQVASYGQVRLSDYGLRPRLLRSDQAAWGDPRRDVSAAGQVLCAALGIDPEQADRQPTAIEQSLPALAATALTIASGSAGRSASTALMMLSDGAGRLAARSRVFLSIAELGRLATEGSPAIAAAVDSVVAPRMNQGQALADREDAPSAAAAAEQPKAQGRETFIPGRPAVVSPSSDRKSRSVKPLPLLPLIALAGALFVVLSLLGPLMLRGSHQAASHRPRASTPARSPGRPAPVVTSTPAPGSIAASNAAAAPQPVPSQAAGAAATADTPQAAVTAFYSAVLQHRFDQAATLWSERMKANYPPSVNIDDRFAGTTELTINQSRLVSSAGGNASLYIDLTEVTYGTIHHWVGTWQLVQTTSGWLLDQPNFQPA